MIRNFPKAAMLAVLALAPTFVFGWGYIQDRVTDSGKLKPTKKNSKLPKLAGKTIFIDFDTGFDNSNFASLPELDKAAKHLVCSKPFPRELFGVCPFIAKNLDVKTSDKRTIHSIIAPYYVRPSDGLCHPEDADLSNLICRPVDEPKPEKKKKPVFKQPKNFKMSKKAPEKKKPEAPEPVKKDEVQPVEKIEEIKPIPLPEDEVVPNPAAQTEEGLPESLFVN